jgi:hypothetical protein
MSIDLATHKPADAGELLKDLGVTAATAAGAAWAQVKANVVAHLETIADVAADTMKQRATGAITDDDVAHTMGLLRTYRDAIADELKVLPFVTAQRVLDGVTGLLEAAFRNVTGIEVAF